MISNNILQNISYFFLQQLEWMAFHSPSEININILKHNRLGERCIYQRRCIDFPSIDWAIYTDKMFYNGCTIFFHWWPL